MIATNVFSNNSLESRTASGPPRFVVMNVWTIAARINAGASAPRRRNTSFPGTAKTAASLPSNKPTTRPNTKAITMRA